MGVLISNEMAEVGAVKTEFESSDILWGADNDQKYERLGSDSVERIIEKHADFLAFIGESKEFDNKNVEILNSLTDTRKRVEFFHELGLADKLNYFASDPILKNELLDFENYLSQEKEMVENDEKLIDEIDRTKTNNNCGDAHFYGGVLSFYYAEKNKTKDLVYERNKVTFFRNIAYRSGLICMMSNQPEYKTYEEAFKGSSVFDCDFKDPMSNTSMVFTDSNADTSDSDYVPEAHRTNSSIGKWGGLIRMYDDLKTDYKCLHPEKSGEVLENEINKYVLDFYNKASSNSEGYFYILGDSGIRDSDARVNYLRLKDLDKRLLVSVAANETSYDPDHDMNFYSMYRIPNLGRFADARNQRRQEYKVTSNNGDGNKMIKSLDKKIYSQYEKIGKDQEISPLFKAFELKNFFKSKETYDDWLNYIPIETIERVHKNIVDGNVVAANEILDDAKNADYYTDCLKQDYMNGMLQGERHNHICRAIQHIDDMYHKKVKNDENFFNRMGEIYAKYKNSDILCSQKWKGQEYYKPICSIASSYEQMFQSKDDSLSVLTTGIEEALAFFDKNPAIFDHMMRDTKSGRLVDVGYGANDSILYRNIKNFYESNDAYRHKWCFDNSYIHLDGGWSKKSIGKIIYNRLETGVESSIHDATYWLESFQIPEEGYDMAALKLAKKQGNDEINLDDFKMKCIDKQEESDFLTQIMSASPEVRSRLKLPNKEQKIQQLFFSPENAAIYHSLLKLYKNEDISYDDLINQVKQEKDEFYSEYINNKNGKSSTWRISKDDFNGRVSEVLAKMQETNTNELWTKRIGERMENLYQYGQNREKYIDDATSWLERHSTVASGTLTLAFGNRALAIADGEKDSASKLVEWTKLNVIETISNSKLPENLTKEEVLGKYENFTKELVRVYPVGTTLSALSKYKNIYNPEKIMPANARKLESGGKEYYGEVLSPEDPRGMTIGVDTGCCMTVDGVSESCITSGYKDKDAGFFALYDGNKKLMAQSYFYINPKQPEVVVMDNIEACQGRDVEKIVDLYKNYFTEYAKEQFGKNPNWQVRQVNIGTGYGEAVKQYVLKLPETEIIKNGHNVYTDADEDQRLLFRLSDKEIEQAKSTRVENTAVDSEKTAKIAPNHDFSIYTDSLSEKQAQIIKEIEAQIYPESMRQYDDEDYLSDEITQPNSEKYSFLIKSEQDASHDTAGYCLAYSAESESDPNYDGKTMYVADFGILPDYRSGPVALKGLEEILKRADSDSIGKIEMDAREATSYKLLTSPWTKRFLKKHGWELTDHGNTVEFDNKEKTILISIDRMSEAA